MKDWPFNWDYLRPLRTIPPIAALRPGPHWRVALVNPTTLQKIGFDPETFVLVWQNMKFKGNEFANTPADRTIIEITAS